MDYTLVTVVLLPSVVILLQATQITDYMFIVVTPPSVTIPLRIMWNAPPYSTVLKPIFIQATMAVGMALMVLESVARFLEVVGQVPFPLC